MDNKANINKVTLEGTVDGKLAIEMPYHPQWIEWIRKVPGRKWDPQLKRWLLPGKHEAIASFCQYFSGLPV